MRQLKNSRFSRVLAEYLKNGSTDFHQTYVSFGQSYRKVFGIKRFEDRPLIVTKVTNSRRSAGLKIMIQWKKSGIFLRLRTDTAFLS